MNRQGSRWCATACIYLVLFAMVGCNQGKTPPSQEAPPPQPPPVKPQPAPVKEDPRLLSEFTERVQQYVKLHKELAASLPRLKTTKKSEKIAEHQRALAQKIREARSGAKQGDIFTREISAQFVLLIRREFRGPGAPAVRKTIREGEPSKDLPLRVGAAYETLPFTTMPPALLLKLPQLPEEVAYRIVGHDLVLHDVGANMIVDFIPEALP